MATNRRNTARRAEVVQQVLTKIVHSGTPVITVKAVEDALQVSPEAAARILDRLVSAGVLEARSGVWVRVNS